jgi:hypothetical protein
MENVPHFVEALDAYLLPGAYVFAGIAGLILLYHEFRILQIRDYKAKYDYVNLHEINYFWYAVMAIVVAVALYINSVASGFSMDIFAYKETWFYVRTFMTLCFLVVTYFLFNSLVKIYYPRFVEKRLAKLRSKPRISPTGNVMRRLSEHEEEAHLEASQFSEQQEVHSVDYDVWLDEATGYKKIEKYHSYQHAVECPECGYVTLKISSEEVEKAPNNMETGLMIKHYKCSYCGHREAKEVVVAALSENIA